MARELFLLKFAEAVRELPRPHLVYDAVTRRNRLADAPHPFAVSVAAAMGTQLTGTSEQRDQAEHSSVDWEGTVLTLTSESKDNVEDDRILGPVSQGGASISSIAALLGTRTDSREQSDESDVDRCRTGVPAVGPPPWLLALLGTEKTGDGKREQTDVTDASAWAGLTIDAASEPRDPFRAEDMAPVAPPAG